MTGTISFTVDGQWADWAAWTTCSVTCFSTTGASNNGSRSRERTCTNPAPAYDGKQCVGDPSETEACSITNVNCPGSLYIWSILKSICKALVLSLINSV